ncbi:uncharacterized protein [Antedon mediterranea]|uniref:uncharacterized protein n=1 Tax=Antedon mediterranea TaxID=105859 RepID=UPI003AF7BFD1
MYKRAMPPKGSMCPIHNTSHSLVECRQFRGKTLEEKSELIKEHRLCFRCLKPNHRSRNCKSQVKCEKCEKPHLTIMHRELKPNQPPSAPQKNLLQHRHRSLHRCRQKQRQIKDAPQFHKVREVINGEDQEPWAHRVDLGWVVIGEVCLNGAHLRQDLTNQKEAISTYYTQLTNGRNSANFRPCENAVEICQILNHEKQFGADIFTQTAGDEELGRSTEDLEFSNLMSQEMVKDAAGNWVAPLPFKTGRQKLPNNKCQATQRMKTLVSSLNKNPKKKAHYFDFMGKILDKRLACRVENKFLKEEDEAWYLPHFGVYHPQKPDKLRVVFDSSATFNGVSLNDTLLSGPDLMNQLLGVLIRFREEPVAVTGDIEQMFYAFKVREDHRKFLRFLWFKDNQPDAEIVTYCMSVHIFGNKPSPAVAISGLRKTGMEGAAVFGMDVKQLIDDNFYMDDLLKSLPTVEEAVDILKRTRDLLSTANIRLHKFTSTNPDVLAAFKPEELAPAASLVENEITSKLDQINSANTGSVLEPTRGHIYVPDSRTESKFKYQKDGVVGSKWCLRPHGSSCPSHNQGENVTPRDVKGQCWLG